MTTKLSTEFGRLRNTAPHSERETIVRLASLCERLALRVEMLEACMNRHGVREDPAVAPQGASSQ